MEERKFVILSDNTVDMPMDWISEHDVDLVYLSYRMDGVDYSAKEGDTLAAKEFYSKIRNGAKSTTSQVNPEAARERLEIHLKEGKDVLYIGFSSGLSGTYNSVKMAMNDLAPDYPTRKMIAVDSLCACMGEGLLLYYVVKMADEGRAIEDVAKWAEENKLHVCHFVAVDDLNHLHRGGRVSKTSAFFGTMLGVKPIIVVDDEGKLQPIAKIRGRKASLDHILDMMDDKTKDYKGKNDIVMVATADCDEDGDYLESEIRRRFGIDNVMRNSIGTVIGSHTGHGTATIFCMGTSREV